MGLFSRILKKNRHQKDYFLALDIGTEFVKALILKVDREQKKGLVVGASRQRQNPLHMQAGAVADIDGVVVACQAAIEQASQMAGLRPKQVVVGIAGELVKGSTTSFIYQRVKPRERIDLPELKNIIQKIQWKAFDQARRQLAWETGRSEIEIKLINALITDIKIDGYRVTNPLDFQGKEVSISIFNVYAPLIHLGALQSIVSKLNLDCLAIAAEPYAVARALNLDSKTGAIIIDIGGGTTDIALIRQIGLEGTKTLALAGRAFTKRLSQQLSLGLTEAEEVKIGYAQQQLSQAVCRKIREIFKKDLKVWLAGVALALEEFPQTEPLPNQILLCGGGSLLPGLKKVLEGSPVQNQWFVKLPFSHSPKVRFIQSKDIIDIIDQTNQLKEPEDITPMALASLILELVEERGILDSVVRRAVRIVQR
jgi:cell division protein FtsA